MATLDRNLADDKEIETSIKPGDALWSTVVQHLTNHCFDEGAHSQIVNVIAKWLKQHIDPRKRHDNSESDEEEDEEDEENDNDSSNSAPRHEYDCWADEELREIWSNNLKLERPIQDQLHVIQQIANLIGTLDRLKDDVVSDVLAAMEKDLRTLVLSSEAQLYDLEIPEALIAEAQLLVSSAGYILYDSRIEAFLKKVRGQINKYIDFRVRDEIRHSRLEDVNPDKIMHAILPAIPELSKTHFSTPLRRFVEKTIQLEKEKLQRRLNHCVVEASDFHPDTPAVEIAKTVAQQDVHHLSYALVLVNQNYWYHLYKRDTKDWFGLLPLEIRLKILSFLFEDGLEIEPNWHTSPDSKPRIMYGYGDYLSLCKTSRATRETARNYVWNNTSLHVVLDNIIDDCLPDLAAATTADHSQADGLVEEPLASLSKQIKSLHLSFVSRRRLTLSWHAGCLPKNFIRNMLIAFPSIQDVTVGNRFKTPFDRETDLYAWFCVAPLLSALLTNCTFRFEPVPPQEPFPQEENDEGLTNAQLDQQIGHAFQIVARILLARDTSEMQTVFTPAAITTLSTPPGEMSEKSLVDAAIVWLRARGGVRAADKLDPFGSTARRLRWSW